MKTPIYKRRWIQVLLGIAIVIALFITFRYPILRVAGNHLVDIDEPQSVEAIVVLGGNSKDRATYGAVMYSQGYAPLVICTGGNIPSVLEAIDTTLYESEISAALAQRLGVPTYNLVALKSSTSTLEEAQEVKAYCEANGLKRIGVLSSMMHTNRVRNVFEKEFEASGIELLIFGAPSTRYDENQWWNSEEGMIMVNNEYMKLLYYFIKH